MLIRSISLCFWTYHIVTDFVLDGSEFTKLLWTDETTVDTTNHLAMFTFFKHELAILSILLVSDNEEHLTNKFKW